MARTNSSRNAQHPPPQQSPVDTTLTQLSELLDRYDSRVRLLFQLTSFVSLVRYNPSDAKRDQTAEFERFREAYDLWERQATAADSRQSRRRVQQLHDRVDDWIETHMQQKDASAEVKVEPRESKSREVSGSNTIKKESKSRSRTAGRPARGQKRSKQETDADRLTLELDATLEVEDEWPEHKSQFGEPAPKRFRVRGLRPRAMVPISHPLHMAKPEYGGDLTALLDSFRLLDDEDHNDDASYNAWVAQQAAAVRRVTQARESGLLAKLEQLGVGTASSHLNSRFSDPIKPAHHDHLVAQVAYLGKLRSNLRRNHATTSKRQAQMVEQYFRRLEGAEEKERKDHERYMRQLARRIGAEVMKKWKLAQKVVEQRRQAALAEVHREKGKEYLNQILEHSSKLIESRVDGLTGADSGEEENLEAIEEEDEHLSDEDDDPEDSDAELTLEQLREKYKSLPDLNLPEKEAKSESEPESEPEHDNEPDQEHDQEHTPGQELDSEVSTAPPLDKPSEEALRLYAEASASGSDSEEESEIESEDDSERDSDSADEIESSSEVSDMDASDTQKNRNGLAQLLGNHVQSESDSDADFSAPDSEAEMHSEAHSSHSDVQPEPLEQETREESEPRENETNEEESRHVESETPQLDTIAQGSPADTQPEEGKHDHHVKFSEPDGEMKIENVEGPEQALERVPESPQSPQNLAKLENEHEDRPTTPVDHTIETPMLLRGNLREYQRDGLDWLTGLANSGTNGILADEMGLGKTIQTIALLAWMACEKHIWGPHLIVVPTSVMLNWEMEFKRFGPGFKVLTYYGNPQQRKRKRRGWNKEDTWHVCITSYQLVIQDQVAFRGKRWQYMILDEAHNIKNFRSQRWQALLNFNAQHRLLLTGTPLQNNLIELWSLLYFLMPSSRATKMMPEGFASLDDFQEWFARPVDQMVEEGEQADDEARATISKLHRVLRPYLLRRLKADVEKQMPAKYEHVVYCRLSKRQRYLYDDFMSRAATRETLASGNYMSILNCLMQLRKVCNHPDLFEVRPIVTSFEIDRSVAGNWVPLARKFDLGLTNNTLPWLDSLNLVLPQLEHEPKWLGLARKAENATDLLIQELAAEAPNTVWCEPDNLTVAGWARYAVYMRRLQRAHRQSMVIRLNTNRTNRVPIYGSDLRELVTVPTILQPSCSVLPPGLVVSAAERSDSLKGIVARFGCVTPAVVCLDQAELVAGPVRQAPEFEEVRQRDSTFHESQVRLSIAFPDKRLLQYDCGKLQTLATLLQDVISGGHRVLIFTQMTRVLDILEQFLNIHGWRYLRLDGSTRVEQRQALTERFNSDPSIPVFILSTRSGGLGINLTGADTVVFYDSDWNPAMDRQCQDRCHRIGQTRDVHVYRLVSEFTIESNILRKATQKTVLDNVVIQEGDFTTEYLRRMSVHDILGDNAGRDTSSEVLQRLGDNFEVALAQAEDADDAAAANAALSEARAEARLEQEEFLEPTGSRATSETPGTDGAAGKGTETGTDGAASLGTDGAPDITPEPSASVEPEHMEVDQEIGHIDDFMIRAIERGDIL